MHTITKAFSGNAARLFDRLKDQRHVFFLDSSLKGASGRFSYLGCNPFQIVSGNSFKTLRQEFNRHKTKPSSWAFPSGAVGYISYEGDYRFGFYDAIVTIDHHFKKMIINASTRAKAKQIEDIVESEPKPVKYQTFKGGMRLTSNFNERQYIQAIKKALDHIRKGDIYQINLSQKIAWRNPQWQNYIHPIDLYQHLRQLSPSPFSGYFDDGTQCLLTSSPERFIKLEEGVAQVRPMKGTRPRGQTPALDKRQKTDLMHSPKEIAELLMVTDLERNDLGRVCEYGSVKVKALRAIETYKTVFQATSTIEGRLRRGCDQFDLLEAVFPSGSVTGCPKIEAMNIIQKLERGPRGLYTGAFGYMSFSGGMDFNVLIRTLFLNTMGMHFHVGGGIVADSNPAFEYKETWVKARAMVAALERAFKTKAIYA